MQVVEINPIPSSRLMNDYLFDFSKVEKYFSYNPYNIDSWKKRGQYLEEQSHIDRNKLVQALMEYNQRFNNHSEVMMNIDKLRSNNTFVVIGGQQAGLLTGPLYVIHKAISILKLAEEMKKETGFEIVPVFWIASEDHDFAEVNHVFVSNADGEMEKIRLSEKGKPKASISELMIESTELQEAIQSFFSYLPDSPFQKELKEQLLQWTEQTNKLSDMFSMIMSSLFGKYGLVLVDSSDPRVRELEASVFEKLIEQNLEHKLIAQEQELIRDGYKPQLDNLQGNANFFLHLDGERHLMTRQAEYIVSKNGKYRFSEAELKQLLSADPTVFSANVVSRPIMQEYLFPVAAFVGGPGEIAYWAQLTPIFSLFGLQMPIVFPRLTFTYIERNIAHYLDRYHLTFEQASVQWEEQRALWLEAQGGTLVVQEFDFFKNQLHDLYKPFLEKICAIEPGARKLGEANWQRIVAHMEFLQNNTNKEMQKRHEASLKQWSSIKQSLYPLDSPQERVYNIYGYLNKYGTSMVDDMLNLALSLSANHKLIYM